MAKAQAKAKAKSKSKTTGMVEGLDAEPAAASRMRETLNL